MRVVMTGLCWLALGIVLSQRVGAEEPRAYTAIDLWSGQEQAEPSSGDRPQILLGPSVSKESGKPSAAIVILPGGGYGGLAIDHEGHQIAHWMQSLGIRPAICTYRHRGKGNGGSGYGHPVPMQDAQRAIRLLRSQADELGIDPARIGVIGFSAGGHLASTISTHFAEVLAESEDVAERVSSRPDFSILCYPVIAFGESFTHGGSQRNLLGNDASPELIVSLSNEKQVSEQTPPTFLFHTAEDKAVPAANSTAYCDACVRHGVPVELHLFPAGRHGIGLGRDVPGASQWPALCADWLARLGMTK